MVKAHDFNRGRSQNYFVLIVMQFKKTTVVKILENIQKTKPKKKPIAKNVVRRYQLTLFQNSALNVMQKIEEIK